MKKKKEKKKKSMGAGASGGLFSVDIFFSFRIDYTLTVFTVLVVRVLDYVVVSWCIILVFSTHNVEQPHHQHHIERFLN